MRQLTIWCIICMTSFAVANSKYSEIEIEETMKENEKLRKELRDESKAAIEARNHAKSLFQELMKWRG